MSPGRPPRPRRWRDRRLFEPILAGATARDRATACVGAGVGIGLVGLVGVALHGDGAASPWIVAPMGASAVLVFAVPASPLAQPWPVVGGNAVSALVGVCVARALGGGGLGLLPAVRPCLSSPPAGDRRAGPDRRPAAAAPRRARSADVDAVLARMGETFDIDRDDLQLLLRELEARVLTRERADLACAEIMSRDVIAVERDADPDVARRLLLDSGVRLLPVLDADAGRLVGLITQADLLAALARPSAAVLQV